MNNGGMCFPEFKFEIRGNRKKKRCRIDPADYLLTPGNETTTVGMSETMNWFADEDKDFELGF